MSDGLVLYTNPMSRGRNVRWMLEEVGAPYRAEVLPFGPALQSEAFVALNPMRKVPVLVHGDQVVTETAAICMYLADAFPERGLAPPHDRRGAYYRWIAFATGPLDAAMANRSVGWEVPEANRRSFGYGDYDRVVETLELAVTGRHFVAGAEFTAADLLLGGGISYGLRMGLLPDRPAFRAYVDHLDARPARQRALAMDAAAQEALEKGVPA